MSPAPSQGASASARASGQSRSGAPESSGVPLLYPNPAEGRAMTEERRRLDEATRRTAHWRRWGPYLSERQWGTVRGDYSPGGPAWADVPHGHGRLRAYPRGEAGPAGAPANPPPPCLPVGAW